MSSLMHEVTQYDTVVGLEVHIQLNTESKAFCSDANVFGDDANTHISAVSLAHPGTLPVANKLQIAKAVKLGIALGCKINEINYFDRKHYFYPDLPKGYQITQDGVPICEGGRVTIDDAEGTKDIRIHHIHMEEDAGKTIHNLDKDCSLVDLNRAGTPLLELVTEPDLASGEEVFQFIAELQRILRFIGISDADMEKGSMRCDCNVSIKPSGSSKLGERCEIKNLNSKRFAREAVEYEVRRQMAMLNAGQSFTKQTLHYDSIEKKTKVLREKEGVQDYRYFKDPDLTPVVLTAELIDNIKSSVPKLPRQIKEELSSRYSFGNDYLDQLTRMPSNYELFDRLTSRTGDARLAANFLINQYFPSQESGGAIGEITLDFLTEFVKLIKDQKVNASLANQKLWPAMLSSPLKRPQKLAGELGILKSEDQGFLDDLIRDVIANHPKQAEAYAKGKKGLLGFFIGHVMKASKGTADAPLVKKKMEEALKVVRPSD